VESLSSPGPTLVHPEKTARESHDDPGGSLRDEAPVELGQSGHGAADCAKLESQSSVGTTSLEQTSLQGLLAAERQHHEIASVLTASTVVLSVCFPQYIIAMPLIHLR
jgi:hypothetical protein